MKKISTFLTVVIFSMGFLFAQTKSEDITPNATSEQEASEVQHPLRPETAESQRLQEKEVELKAINPVQEPNESFHEGRVVRHLNNAGRHAIKRSDGKDIK